MSVNTPLFNEKVYCHTKRESCTPLPKNRTLSDVRQKVPLISGISFPKKTETKKPILLRRTDLLHPPTKRLTTQLSTHPKCPHCLWGSSWPPPEPPSVHYMQWGTREMSGALSSSHLSDFSPKVLSVSGQHLWVPNFTGDDTSYCPSMHSTTVGPDLLEFLQGREGPSGSTRKK